VANTVLGFMDKKTNKPIRCPDEILQKINEFQAKNSTNK
jgi:acyl-CoA thioesterase FadM